MIVLLLDKEMDCFCTLHDERERLFSASFNNVIYVKISYIIKLYIVLWAILRNVSIKINQTNKNRHLFVIFVIGLMKISVFALLDPIAKALNFNISY